MFEKIYIKQTFKLLIAFNDFVKYFFRKKIIYNKLENSYFYLDYNKYNIYLYHQISHHTSYTVLIQKQVVPEKKSHSSGN